MATGIGNGFPLAAVATTREIAESLTGALHFNTYGGGPLAATVGMAVLEILEQEGCQNISHNIGTYMLQRFDELRSKHAVIGDVRGKGLMMGFELIDPSGTSSPIPRSTPMSPEKVAEFFELTKDMGVLIGKGGLHGNVMRLTPPMCIDRDDADFAVEVIDFALSKLFS